MLPRHRPYFHLSSHVSAQSAVDVILPRVTLPVVTRVTSALVHPYAQMFKSYCHVSLLGSAMCHHPELPRHFCHISIRTCHVSVCTDCIINNYFFACLTFRTECDIFSIRTLFDIKIIPLESGRRDGRNGVGFIRFRALSFLSIFHALIAF